MMDDAENKLVFEWVHSNNFNVMLIQGQLQAVPMSRIDSAWCR